MILTTQANTHQKNEHLDYIEMLKKSHSAGMP